MFKFERLRVYQELRDSSETLARGLQAMRKLVLK